MSEKIPDRSLQIIDQTVYLGPNRYGYHRGISLVVDLGDLEDEPTMKLKGFNEKLLELIPTLDQHTCSYDSPGGFIRRLTEEEGTWLGHVFEHVAIEIQSLCGIGVSYGKTRQIRGEVGRTGKESVYRVYFELRNEETALAATKLALRVVNYLVDQTYYPDFDYKKELIEVIQISEEYAYGPSTGSIVDEATTRGIPSIRLRKTSSLVQFGWGKNQKRIWASTSSNSSYISTEIAQDKELTLQLLYDVGIPVPRGGVARTLEQAHEELDRIGFPVVIKPLDVSHGRGVSLNIDNIEDFDKAFEYANSYAREVIIERFVEGRDFRVLVINGQFTAAAERVPAHVVGDGTSTIQELIDKVNLDPRRGIGHEKVLTKIYIDENTNRLLEDQKFTLESIPEAGIFVQLKSTANLSTGGTSVDVTNIIHFENIQLAERAVKTIGLDIAGVDIIAPDITTPIKTNGGVIIEVNAAPGFRMHIQPTEGTHRNVAKPVIDMLFPDNSQGRIPLVAVTGTNGKTTVSRWIAHIFKLTGKKVGLTTTDGIYIDGILEYSGDCTGPWSAKVVLRDPTVDMAVLETARGGILREGLGWDFCDVAVFLNVSDDHLGLRGVDTLQEMAEIKGVILDQVKDSGFGVLNADDQLVMAQRDRISGDTILVSLDYNNPKLLKHVDYGGTAVTITPNGVLQLIQGRSQTPILQVKDIPATFGGHAIFNIQNAMFAVAATYPFVSIDNIRLGLSSFSMNYKNTPGRLNIERLKGGVIIIDYGHNPKALEAQIQLVNGFFNDQGKIGRKALVFGMPGDRPDTTIIEAARNVANKYDRYYLKDDWYLRGREDGEVPKIIKKALLDNGVNENQIDIFYGDQTELDAVSAMYDWMSVNDIIMLQADDVDKVRNHLLVHLAKVADSIITTTTIAGEGEPRNVNYASFVDDKKIIDEQSD
ncbi:MAG: cyanophycin synthetase [Candidatus Heimdallarchaeota archaeon]|nr:cyanophycin synthetase [Candidatus Heimdallarchaeota archaeon]